MDSIIFSILCLALVPFSNGAIADYGTWKSPITSDIIANDITLITNDLDIDNEGRIYWTEIRSSEEGRGVLCSKKPGGLIEEWTPKEFNVRSSVHEYGGGGFFVGPDGVYFSNFNDQRLYRQTKPGSTPEALTANSTAIYRYADGQYMTKANKIVSVKEDHGKVVDGDYSKVINTIIVLDPKTKTEYALVSGADFYSFPRVSPNGKHFTWCQWNHPNMPFDQTEIYKADLNIDGTAILPITVQKIAGQSSAIVPNWSPSNELYYIDDKTNWWNLYKYNEDTKQGVNLIPKQSEIGGPLWAFGMDGYAFSKPESGFIYTTYQNELGKYNTQTKQYQKLNIGDLIPAGSGPDLGGIVPSNVIVSSPDGSLYLIAASSTEAPKLIRFHPENETVEVIKETLSVKIDADYISKAEKLTYPTSDNAITHAYLYMPKNKDFSAPTDQLPPLMVRSHGGPTASTYSTLNLKHQYLTSRGFAVLDVDYRGSTGYGKIYRDLLKTKWGKYDIDDVCNGALFLVNQSKVDGKRLSIDGGSAGGYTTLAALTFRSVFNAGISYFGVSDMEKLAMDIEKFEIKYIDNLIAPYPQNKSILYDLSPINHVDKLNAAMAFFQGGQDKVVDPSQAEKMFNMVKQKGHPTAFVLFPEEQHGFRIAKNVKKSIDGELYFLSKVFGFKAADLEVDMEIFNLK